KSIRPATDGQSTLCASTRPVTIAPANKPGPRPLTAALEFSVRSRKSALHASSPFSTRNASARTSPTMSRGRARRARRCRGASGREPIPPCEKRRGRPGRPGRRTRRRADPPRASPAARRARRTGAQARAARRSHPSPAGSRVDTQPTSPRRARRPRTPRRGLSPYSEGQIPLDEIVLLQPPQAFAEPARAHRADTADRLHIALSCTDDRVQVAEFADDLLDDAVRESRYPRQDS